MTQQPLFQVIKPGALTTFQDLGRYGYQQFGVPVSGAMDGFALQVANLLVGNPRDAAMLEITFIGPELLVQSPCIVAITGADLQPSVNGKAVPMWQTLKLKVGDILKFAVAQSGVRAYLAVSGGYQAPMILNSQSTYVRANLGEKIAKDAVIYGMPTLIDLNRGISLDARPSYSRQLTCKVIRGIHHDLFASELIHLFYKSDFVVSPQADRMGYRLTSDQVLTHDIHLTSDAVANGTIQLPANGEPIILLADRQTTGGYPIIANVISADLPMIAQLAPGGTIEFTEVTLEEAHADYLAVERKLHRIEHFLSNF